MARSFIIIATILLAIASAARTTGTDNPSAALPCYVASDTTALPAPPRYSVRKSRNIIVVDSGQHTRAFEPFGAQPAAAVAYAETVNKYKRMLGDSVNVYCMTVPNAVAYYCPPEASQWTRQEKPALDNLYRHLSDSIQKVQIYDVLQAHREEPIYSRTDHHWAPLGAYYAAERFAQVAGVKFKPLSSYQPVVVRQFVGSMYTFSKDMAVKNAPEDFVYYEPKDQQYKATFVNYTLAKGRTVGESAPVEKPFFVRYKDGSPGAYCCFMGGDPRTVKVETRQKNNRRLLIMKDSYGNAVASNLFCAFEEVHVIDFRYFPHNIISYIRQNHITDLLFCNNLIHACSQATPRKYTEMLNR